MSYYEFFYKAFFMENLTVTIKSKKNYFRKNNYCFNVVLGMKSALKMKKFNIS
jgi:hypothetical protein